MKIKRSIAFIVFGVIVWTSCKNSLNVQAPYKPITVIYGLIDQNDTTHYFRINKGFEGVGNAYTMAKVYDSIYYPVTAITAVLQDSNTSTGAVITIPLTPDSTVPLGPGTFSYPKQLLYKTKTVLNTNTTEVFNLLLTNTVTGKKSRGSTALLPDAQFTTPNISILNDPHKSFYLEDAPYFSQLAWNTSPNARIYQMTFEFYYDNQFGVGPRVIQPPLQLVFAVVSSNTLAGGEPLTYNINAQQLFALILSNVPSISGVTRHADSLGIIFTSGTDDLNTYIQLSQPPTGINQDVPSFSDVTNGVGLYTARHVQTFYKLIDPGVIDSLTQESRFTALGFVP